MSDSVDKLVDERLTCGVRGMGVRWNWSGDEVEVGVREMWVEGVGEESEWSGSGWEDPCERSEVGVYVG